MVCPQHKLADMMGDGAYGFPSRKRLLDQQLSVCKFWKYILESCAAHTFLRLCLWLVCCSMCVVGTQTFCFPRGVGDQSVQGVLCFLGMQQPPGNGQKWFDLYSAHTVAMLPKVREVTFPRKQREVHYHLQSMFTSHLILIPCGSARPIWENFACMGVICYVEVLLQTVGHMETPRQGLR